MCHRRNGNLSKDGKEEKLFEEWGLMLEWTETRWDDFQVVSLQQNKLVNLSEP